MLLLQVVVVVWLNRRVASFLFRHSGLEEQAYERATLLPALLADPSVVAFAVVHLGAVLLGRRAFGWEALDTRRCTRWFVFLVAGIFAWTYSAGAPNPYFDQAYGVDRVVLLLLWGLVWLHPGFVGPFLVLFLAIALQGYHPLPEAGWMWPDKRLPLDALILFEAVWAVRSAWGRWARPALFPLLVLCLTGGYYGHAGLNKLLLGPQWLTWPLENDVSNLFVSSYVHGGWLESWGEERVLGLAQALQTVHVPLALGVLAIELSGLAILVSWRAARVALALFVVLHAGILVASGIFFWKWILFDLALLAYLASWRTTLAPAVAAASRDRAWFGSWATIVGTFLVLTSPLHFQNVSFAWFDTRLTNFYLFTGEGVSGRAYPIHPRFFAPYDLIVQQSRFYYSTDDDVLVGTYGTTLRYEVLRALQRAGPDDVPELRRRLGQNHYDPEKTAKLEAFLRRSLSRGHDGRTPGAWFESLAPPFHFRCSVPENAYSFQEPLRAVRVDLVETLYDGRSLTVTRRQPVLDLRLTPPR